MNDIKRGVILKNVAMLYLRMLFIVAVTLYMSRMVLDILGETDFGIYHVVAGFVTILGFFHGAMSSATQRYYSYELGKNENANLNGVFSTSVNIHVILVFVIILLAETIGFWFISNKLNIPLNRFDSAIITYHFSLLSFCFMVLTVPFTALIVAYERMGVFAFVSIFDVLLKFFAVILLTFSSGDKLASYAMFLFIVSIVTLIIYISYCKFYFKNVRYSSVWNYSQFKEMVTYTGWNTWGNLSAALSTQGTNVLLNMFFGPSVNAARAVAFQANSAIKNFTQSLQVAINPQIIKLYASGHKDKMIELVLIGARCNGLLLFLVTCPVYHNVDGILSLWLINVPYLTSEFLKLIIIVSLIDSLSGTLMTSCQATGRIKLYQSVVGSILLLNIPLSYIILTFGYPAYSVLIVTAIISIFGLVARLLILRVIIGLSIKKFYFSVVNRVLLVAIVGCLFSEFFSYKETFGVMGLAMSMMSIIFINFFCCCVYRHYKKRENVYFKFD